MKTLARARFDSSVNLWVVEVFSISSSKWLIQGEHDTAERANADLASWNNEAVA